MILPWQHIGNKKPDSRYTMKNTDNQNTLHQITHTKLFKTSFTESSGNKAKCPFTTPINVLLTLKLKLPT